MYLTKAIVIFAEEDDVSAKYVCEWLKYFNYPYYLITEKQELTSLMIEIKDFSQPNFVLEYKDFKISNKKNLVYWFRRGEICLSVKKKFTFKSKTGKAVDLHLESEKNAILSFLYWIFKRQCKTIDSPLLYNINKLSCLTLAHSVGLKIPESLVTTNKTDLSKFKKSPLVTKSIQDYLEVELAGSYFMNYTAEVDKREVPENFFCTLFQKKIIKGIDIRIFYAFNVFYAMAIDTSATASISTDFRRHYSDSDYKSYPYKLTTSYEKKLKRLITHYGFDTCSIDLIKSQDGELYFIEINPVGQFDFLSYFCNYNIEKHIAVKLIEKLKNVN